MLNTPDVDHCDSVGARGDFFETDKRDFFACLPQGQDEKLSFVCRALSFLAAVALKYVQIPVNQNTSPAVIIICVYSWRLSGL